jgi:hypothetical protein
VAPETHYERVVRFLREQPARATIPYRDDAVPPECPIAFGWTDACPGDLRTWLTVVPPDEPSEDPMDMTWPYDATLEIAYDAGGAALPSIRLIPDGRPASAVEAPGYAASIRELWTSWWLERLEPAGDGVWRRRVWTLSAIEAALEDWSARHAGRADLRFVFDPRPSFMVAGPDVTST